MEGMLIQNQIHQVCLVLKCPERIEFRQLFMHCIGYEFRIIKLDGLRQEHEKTKENQGKPQKYLGHDITLILDST